jgi:hypothetical protein
MRGMVGVEASPASAAGVLPGPEILAEMGKFNEELVKAGVMLAGEGRQASSPGKRVRCSGRARAMIDGPFASAKRLIAGFWLWQVRSRPSRHAMARSARSARPPTSPRATPPGSGAQPSARRHDRPPDRR